MHLKTVDLLLVLPREQTVFVQLFLSQMTQIQLAVLLVMVGNALAAT
jgi:hypothetical protein